MDFSFIIEDLDKEWGVEAYGHILFGSVSEQLGHGADNIEFGEKFCFFDRDVFLKALETVHKKLGYNYNPPKATPCAGIKLQMNNLNRLPDLVRATLKNNGAQRVKYPSLSNFS